MALALTATSCIPPAVEALLELVRPPRWSRASGLPFQGTRENARIADLAGPHGGPWRAVGYLEQPDGGLVPTVWSSQDGTAWDSLALPLSETDEEAQPLAIAQRGDVAVVAGTSRGPEGFMQLVVWRQAAGEEWARVPSGSIPRSSPIVAITDVAAGPSGLVLVGARPSARGGDDLAVWTSSDGMRWRAVEDASFRALSGEELYPYGVAVDGRTTVIVGEAIDPQRGPGLADGVVWRGSGDSWLRVAGYVAGMSGSGHQRLGGVVSFRGGYLAVGEVQPGDRSLATAWISEDGQVWRRLSRRTLLPERRLRRGQALVSGVAVGGDRVFVAAQVDGATQLWASRDGIRWRRQPLPDPVRLAPGSEGWPWIAAGPKGVLLTVHAPERSWLWFRRGRRWVDVMGPPTFPSPGVQLTAAAVAQGSGRLVAVGWAGVVDAPSRVPIEQGLAWVSEDGRSWERVTQPTLAGAKLFVVAPWGDRFVAAGQAVEEGRQRARIWWSDRGSFWHRARLPPSEARPLIVVGLARLGERLVAIANVEDPGGDRAVAWHSTDGLRWSELGPVGNLGEWVSGLCGDGTRLLAVGSAPGREGLLRVLGWSSSDGKRWELVLDELGAPGAMSCAIGPDVDVVSEGSGEDAVVWFRARGEAWDLAHTFGGTGFVQPGRAVSALVWDPDQGFIATGSEEVGGNRDLRVWVSEDGDTWTATGIGSPVFEEEGLQEGLGVAFTERLLVVAGYHGADAAIWIGPRIAADPGGPPPT